MTDIRTILQGKLSPTLRGWVKELLLSSLHGKGLGVGLLLLLPLALSAQVRVKGNIYGGGNMGDVKGSTTVTVQSGDLNKVFGGARMADISGNTYVHIDGKNATGYTVINYVFGGNDIAGHIGTAAAVGETLPAELTGNKDGVDNTWNSYVHISSKTTSSTVYYTAEEAAEYNTAHGLSEGDAQYRTTNDIKTQAVVSPDNEKIMIGQLFAGGNGDYYYNSETAGGKTTHNIYVKEGGDLVESVVTDEGVVGFKEPEVAKTYLDIQGGSIAYTYGGGNNATVTNQAIIHVDNPSEVVNEINVNETTHLEDDVAGTNILTTDRFRYDMGINTAFSQYSSDEFQIARLFGGNNKAEMAIMPTWNLRRGTIRDLYSGGDRGAMTSPNGLLLSIPATSAIVVDNLYGGCRMADVFPKKNGEPTVALNLPGYHFPDELSARVLIYGGDINNVYGGNDVTGKVYGGNAVGVYTSIRGDLYGGGNGAYPYTDILKGNDLYGDFYYEQDAQHTSTYDALNAFRPNAEQVSVRVKGTEANPTVIGGSIFCGGNCATLKPGKANPLVELKFGSYVIANDVFLGNNGTGMVNDDYLQLYADESFNSMTLTDASAFAEYMEGVAMNITPSVVFDKMSSEGEDYIAYSTKIGSFYCGGNVGSMTTSGKMSFKFDRELVIFDKFVAGCNNANITAQAGLNADYQGGVMGSIDERNSYMDGDKIKDRIDLDLRNIIIQPQRWDDTFTPIPDGTTLTADKEYYSTNLRSRQFIADGTEISTADNPYYELTTKGTSLVWNTVKWNEDEEDICAVTPNGTFDEELRLTDGNIYGGCYNSGHVNGNVVININRDLVEVDKVFTEGAGNSCVPFADQRDDLTILTMTVFGAGKGPETEIWGSTTVNHNNGYIMQIFGGGEEGVVGKKNIDGEYEYNANYSTNVNLQGPNAGYADGEGTAALAEVEYIYGGGSEGEVCGNSYVHLGNGRLYGAFGGSSNADILGGAELHIGYNGYPWVRENVYGGNDFGGNIKGYINHSTSTSRTPFDIELLKASTYVKYIQGRVDSIFGGNYGSYNYASRDFELYTDDDGNPKDGFTFPHLTHGSFVHFTPSDNASNDVSYIFGGSEGFPGNNVLNNGMQLKSYVLMDDTNTKNDNRFAHVDIFGGGAYAGVGASPNYGAGRTVIDLYAGRYHDVYGACNQEGLVGYSRVNVPTESTVWVNSIFGGGQGYTASVVSEKPVLGTHFCDTYVTCIDYKSKNAKLTDALYGGNRNSRIACDTYINVEAPALQSSTYQASIYGGGYGNRTVSGRTHIFMNNGSLAYKVFGGGRDGKIFNFASLRRWLYDLYSVNHPVAEGATQEQKDAAAAATTADVTAYGDILRTFATYLATNPITLPDKTGSYPNASGFYDGTYTNDIMVNPTFFNTNVHIMDGGNVSGYAYGGGFGEEATVAGTTYVELKGGTVDRDIYGGGQGGSVYDEYKLNEDADLTNDFTATTNVYIEGGMARNVYGGGYLGHIGRHADADGNQISNIYIDNIDDIPGVTNVVIGKTDGTSFYNGVPAIMRNVYGGGEGGSVYGIANVTLNNGYIGYRYKNTGTEAAPVYEYIEELDDQKPNAIELAGNVFGGGYVINSYVDTTFVTMYGGTVRGSLYGGGEVGPIGRGTMQTGLSGGIKNGAATIFAAGKTHVKMFNGLVKRNIFGGGRGQDSWGGDGTMYMDPNLVATLDMQCKGFVFGQTDVCIHGGEVGTEEGMVQNYGNVFGGCDEGSVYSAYDNPAKGEDHKLSIGYKDGIRYQDVYQGYYYKYEWDGSKYDIVTHNVAAEGQPAKYERYFTEDCKVLVEPWLQVKTTPITYGGKTYQVGDYIPTAYLNTLDAKVGDNWPTEWDNVDVGTTAAERGIHIHNAVFAGGNIAIGSSSMYANEITVYGNATASIHDVYNRDLITIGTGHTGGLYGDGNLTFVDGYRELNITNYGTDKYHLTSPLSIDAYKLLPGREQAYYEPKYECAKACQDNAGTIYSIGSSLPYDELTVLFLDDHGESLEDNKTPIMTWDGVTKKWIPNETYWKEKGVVSTYAGRIMNTIQRADFCGVFGSRMVMKGAQDRVPEIVDHSNYTINRVREVSLNKMVKNDEPADENKLHGNYFGIYSLVNYLGALTSDVDFHSVRTTAANVEANPDLKADGTTTFEQWKEAHKTDRTRNNGTCHNQLALASGVYLELTTEKSTGNTLTTKDWGPITGVIELDLINVQPGVGGGFVYAKNQHGYRSISDNETTTLTALNKNAVTQWDFTYDTTDQKYDGETNTGKHEWETSGNFIHSSQTIIDDCYNISNRYLGATAVPAHYWYIAGQVYVYDQYISAHTGSPNAYSETVEIPITINAASNGTMTLVDVQPSRYAYYSSYTSPTTNTPLNGDQKLVINDVTYQLNDAISYWEWYKLPKSMQSLFVEQTYVTVAACKVGDTEYPAGTVMLKKDYDDLAFDVQNGDKTFLQKKVIDEVETYVTPDENFTFDYVFRSSNNMSHGTGYILTYEVTNPGLWDQWYTEAASTTHAKRQTEGDGYEDGPTYHPTVSGLYGRKEYAIGDIISKTVYDTYNKAVSDYNLTPSTPATFVPAYLVTTEYTSDSQHYYPGAAISVEISEHTAPAYVCKNTIQLSSTEYILVNDLMTASDKEEYKTKYPDVASDIEDLVVPAYYCTEAGLYGGDYYEKDKNYRALTAWSAMPEEDRSKFTFNYDALDLLIDPNFGGTKNKKYQYDSSAATLTGAQANNATYSLPTPIDYTATKYGASVTLTNGITLTRGESTLTNQTTVQEGDELTREVFESLPNEQRHYAPVLVSKAGDYYVVNTSFVHVETPYAAGSTISSEEFERLSHDEQTNYITQLTFTTSDFPSGGNRTYYFCREEYKIGEKGDGHAVTALTGKGGTTGDWDVGDTVPVGALISDASYTALPNKQTQYTIHGVSPMETSTLFVSRNSDINDLSEEKIITVIYKYDYEESDESGMHITPVTERHVVNIHITFKSGVPTVGDILQPGVVLPGTSITMRTPSVTPGAYEILGGGWEIFDTESNAESHFNGKGYTPSVDSLYWYQDGFYLAYYARTYLGKTYSNHVPISVANYHDLKGIMDDKKYHLHVDYDRNRLRRDSKIYINNYSSSSQNGADLLKDFFNLTLLSKSDVNTDPETGLITTIKPDGTEDSYFKGHALLNNSTTSGTSIYDGTTNIRGIKGGTNLEFFLRSDIDHGPTEEPNPAYDPNEEEGPLNPMTITVEHPWSTIANNEGECFNGTLHGDGHTISGLNHSLFGHLCGNVYNLGVTGSFTSAGVADEGEGYVESCWIYTTASEAAEPKPYPVFGNPSDDHGQQLVNSYYYKSNEGLFNTATHARGNATAMPDLAFYNGTVAYDLNNFYLYKRYNDHETNSGLAYNYFRKEGEGLSDLQTGYYGSQPEHCSSGFNNIQYVEDRFEDGDFRYANGTIPTQEDERCFIDTEDDNKIYYFPIWPDDYFFFGQKLTFGYSATETHQDKPSAIVRSNGRLSQDIDANRVYRAPAYYRSSVMDVAHFNPNVYLAGKSSDGTKTVYPNMTAIDFAGHNDNLWRAGSVSEGFPADRPVFYPPLLDDDGLLTIINCDETPNLLVYAPAETALTGYANEATYTVLNNYFVDLDYSSYYDNTKGYRLVRNTINEVPSINGHLVQSDLTATSDHLLVDKMDFNAPIAYHFDGSHRMWYQRTPDAQEFVDQEKGWQGISIPFTAELVTTHQKGEITHFYSGSESSKNGTDSKIGHEYWLRQFSDIREEGTAPDVVAKAGFIYPTATGNTKTVTNTFLWDYYYKNTTLHNQKDANDDTYQTYYKKKEDKDYVNEFSAYPYLNGATPYLLGLPGNTYYEFDLSGIFQPVNTAVEIPGLGTQTITFASETGASIGVSDSEMGGVTHTFSGSKDYTFTFKPNYLTENLTTSDYVLKADGSQFDHVTAAGGSSVSGGATLLPFRPYFSATASAHVKGVLPGSILFSGEYSIHEEPDDTLNGRLEVYAVGRTIVTKSHFMAPVTVRITDVGGIHIANFVLQPGQTIKTPVKAHGLYIVNKNKIYIH